ncbi:hypothetical protein B0J13DRAFT_608112 [Dactylonectria estremocensis]|uniref:C2H2-type domain-containing protein n=1 Tax=Dactylonectria estremocensis TaxID=1079267 RepID=A0A9P9J201_9HYPO|nr:hypothetical protein B0J13DRAFT_608112 [Dactylonectria estremocensis]
MEDLRCRYCPRDFIKKDHVARHERIHTRERPFSCPTCLASFARKDVLKRHERSHSRNGSHYTKSRSVVSDAVESSTSRPPEKPPTPQQSGVNSTMESLIEMATDFTPVLDGSFAGLSDLGLEPRWMDHQTGLEAHLGTWSTPSSLPSFSGSSSLPLRDAEDDLGTVHSGSFDICSENQPAHSDQASLYLGFPLSAGKIGCQQGEKDRRSRLVVAIHEAHVTNWCMDDFKMSIDIFQQTEAEYPDNGSTLHVHKQLTTPMIFEHGLTPNPRFMKMCYNLYVEIVWPRFPVIHLPSLAPSCENNQLLFFAICVVGSVFTGSKDALDFGVNLGHRVGFLIMSKWKSIMSRNSSSTNQTILILVQMHLELHSLLSGNSELLALSMTHHGALILWARRASILRDLNRVRPHHNGQAIPREISQSESYSFWRTWIDEEMKLRIAHMLAIIDSELCAISNQPPSLKRNPDRAQPLASNALFAAQTAEEWRVVLHSQNLNAEAENFALGRLPSMAKDHWLEIVLAIQSVANEMALRRDELHENGTETLLGEEDTFLGRLVERLPLMLADLSASRRDVIIASILNDSLDGLSEQFIEVNILWHSTLISLLIDPDAIERYHGRDGAEIAYATHVTLPPAVVVRLVLHCLIIRSLVQQYALNTRHVPVFVARCVLSAAMVFNWYRDHKGDLFSDKSAAGLCDVSDEPFVRPATLRFEDWASELGASDPFIILIQEQSSRKKLQSMLDSDDVISCMARTLKRLNGIDGIRNNFVICLDILASNEMDLDISKDEAE